MTFYNFSYLVNMKKYLLIPFFCASVLIQAQNNQKIIPLDSELYNIMDLLFLEQGLSRPSTARPWSEDEVIFMLENIDYQAISEAGRKGLDFIDSSIEKPLSFKKGSGPVRAGASLELNFEAYLKNVLKESGTDDDSPYPWMYGYEDRLPLVNIPLEMEFYDFFYADVELELKEEPNVIEEIDNNYTNIITDPMHINLQFPFRTFLSAGDRNWNIQFGRDNLSWGNGFTGNMMLNDNSEYYDFVKGSVWWEKFKFSTVYISLEPWLTEVEQMENPVITKNGAEFDEELYKAFFGHRLEFDISPRISMALSESVIFGRKYPDLKDFNPFMIFHNWYIEERANSLISAEINITPFKGISVYGQVGVDQFQTSGEKDTYGDNADSLPNAYGFLTGIRGLKIVADGYLTGNIEYAYTNPWMYTSNHTLLSYTSRWRVISNVKGDTGYKIYDKPLGYETGPDSRIIYTNINYTVPDYYSIGLETTYRQQGENTIYTEYASGDDPTSLKTPSGDNPVHQVITRLNGEIKLKENLKVGNQFYWSWEYNADHIRRAVRNRIEWVPFISISY